MRAEENVKSVPRTVLVKQTHIVDLECCGMFELEEGRTYYDDGTTVFDVYISGGLADGRLEEAKRSRDTIIVSAHDLLRS